MANRRDLKKDINFLTYQVINECYAYLDYAPEGNYENVMDIILEVVDLRNELIYRLNHINNDIEKKERKAYFKKIISELYEKNIEFIDRLNSFDK